MNGGRGIYLEGCELLERGKYQEAAARFSESLAEMPHFKTYERLGECYEALGKFEKAFECACAAYSLNSCSDKTAFRYAELLVRYKNDIPGARGVLAGILARNPSYRAARELSEEIDSK